MYFERYFLIHVEVVVPRHFLIYNCYCTVLCVSFNQLIAELLELYRV